MEMNRWTAKTLNREHRRRLAGADAGRRKVQSIDQFLMSEPAIRRAVTNAKPVCLFAGDYGPRNLCEFGGVAEDFLTKNPEAGEEIRARGAQRLEGCAADPEEAARIEVQYVKALDPQIIVEEIQILKRIAITPDVEKNGFGTFHRAHEEHRGLHQQETSRCGREAHGGADLPRWISPRDADQAVILLEVRQSRALGAFPPPLAAELGFTRVRPRITCRSRINPTSAGGLGRGHATNVEGQCKTIHVHKLTPSPTLPHRKSGLPDLRQDLDATRASRGARGGSRPSSLLVLIHRLTKTH